MKSRVPKNTQPPKELRRGWYEVRANSAQLDSAGIYEWKIKDVAVYVGKSENIRSRMMEYPNNIRKMINGLPYRLRNEDGYRSVHRKLCEAHDKGFKVTFSVLEICEPEFLSEREDRWIEATRTKNAGSRVEVLNRTKPRKQTTDSAQRGPELRPDRENTSPPQKTVQKEKSMQKVALREGWYEMCADRGQLQTAGVFAWIVKGIGIYVGRSKRLDEILHHMEEKVAKLLNNGGRYREIYHRLCEAHQSKTLVQFKVLELCDPELLNERKKVWISRINKEQGAHGLPIMRDGSPSIRRSR